MSDNELSTLMGSSNLPAFARDGRGAKLNQEAAAGTGGEGINRISLKQSRFRLIVGGEQVSVIQEPHMDVVIVRANPGVSRAYYKKKYDPNADDQSPDCYSSNGIVPDADVQHPECANCADCPNSQWGSRINDLGNKVKLCSEVKRIAIVPASNVEAPMFQIAVPAASLKVFGGFVRMLNQATPAIPYNGVVTRVGFDETSDFPKLTFKPHDWVTDEQYKIIEERFDSEEARRVATIVPAPQEIPRAKPQAQPDPQPEPVKDPEPVKQPAPEPQAQPKPQGDPWAQATQAAEQPKAEPKPQAKQDDPWATATQAAEQPKEESKQAEQPKEEQPGADAFAQAGWGGAAPEAKEPPAKAHDEQQAKVVEGDDIDDIFGAGFDD